jgi:hypothetical protein
MTKTIASPVRKIGTDYRRKSETPEDTDTKSDGIDQI